MCVSVLQLQVRKIFKREAERLILWPGAWRALLAARLQGADVQFASSLSSGSKDVRLLLLTRCETLRPVLHGMRLAPHPQTEVGQANGLVLRQDAGRPQREAGVTRDAAPVSRAHVSPVCAHLRQVKRFTQRVQVSSFSLKVIAENLRNEHSEAARRGVRSAQRRFGSARQQELCR